MRVIRYLPDEALYADGCVLTIGNFDGVHRGHQYLLKRLVERGKELGLPVVVMIFDPQPREFFRPDSSPVRLSTTTEKINLLKVMGVDDLLLLRFNRRFSSQTAAQFVQLLVDRLNLKYLVIGDDFHFGKGREGNFEYLKAAAEEFAFEVENSSSYNLGGSRVSSTRIRKQLASGELLQAAELLGRPYNMSGRVIHGDKRGREIGFPTANIRVKNRKSPVQGVFAVTMTDAQSRLYTGVANVGTRPTVDDTDRVLLEVHLFDFDGDLYGRRVHINFLHKIRDEYKFPDVEALKSQIQMDCQDARRFFDTA